MGVRHLQAMAGLRCASLGRTDARPAEGKRRRLRAASVRLGAVGCSCSLLPAVTLDTRLSVSPRVMRVECRASGCVRVRASCAACAWWRRCNSPGRLLFPYWYISALYHLSRSPSSSPSSPPSPFSPSASGPTLPQPQPPPVAVAVAASVPYSVHARARAVPTLHTPNGVAVGPRRRRRRWGPPEPSATTPIPTHALSWHRGPPGPPRAPPISSFGKWDLFVHLFQRQLAVSGLWNGQPGQRPDAPEYFTISYRDFEAVW